MTAFWTYSNQGVQIWVALELTEVGAPKGGCFDQGLFQKLHPVVSMVPRKAPKS